MRLLTEAIQDVAVREQLVVDIASLIDRRVAAVRGLSGVAIKGGYKIVSSMKQGRMIPGAVNYLLQDFCVALDPFVEQSQEQADGRFDVYVRGREDQVANALLAITDAKARNANALLAKPYQKLRAFGEAQVRDAVPDIAIIVTRTVQ